MAGGNPRNSKIGFQVGCAQRGDKNKKAIDINGG